MNLQLIFFTQGLLLLLIGAAALFPFALDGLAGHDNVAAFGWSALGALFFGGSLCLTNRGFSKEVSVRYAFALTTVSWLTIIIFGAVPLYYSDAGMSWAGAIFESASGFTTTGSTVLSGLDGLSHGVILWRAMTQWIGGIGIIAFAMILMPFLRIGGMQLFRSESSDKSEKIMPKTTDVVLSIINIYVILTVICFLVYYLLGMGRFDALIHSLTTICTGGFSSHDLSFGFFQSPSLQLACTFFMLISGVPFILFVKWAYQGRFEFFKDAQVKTYLAICAVITVILTLYLWNQNVYDVGPSFIYAVFNTVSIITTTGYATTDYGLWPPFALTIFFFLTYVGACAGSTAGGIKVLRFNIAFEALRHHIKKLVYPHGAFSLNYQNKPLGLDVIYAAMSFLFLYVFFNVILTIVLTGLGLDFMTAVTATATAIANVGPGLGEIIGPSGNFSSLPETAKWLLAFAMLLGRLEVMTMLVLLVPAFWQR